MKYKAIISIMVIFVMVLSMMMVMPVNNNQNNIVNDASSASLNSTINGHFRAEHNYGAKLTYNSTSGLVSGKYLKTTFNNGVFTNLTYNQTSTVLINKMYANGTSVFNIMHMHNLLINNTSYTLGNLFLYMNSTSFFALHNNPAMETGMSVHDGEIHIYLPSRAKIYNTTNNTQVTTKANASFNSQINSNMFGDVSMATNLMLDFNNTINAGREMIMIDNNGTVAMLFVHGGNFTIYKNEITVYSKGTAMVNMVVPPGLQKMPENKTIVNNIMKGKIASEISLNLVNGTKTNTTINYNSSIALKYTGSTKTTDTFDVNSSVNHSTIISIFIGKNVTKDTGNAYVKFDGKVVSKVSFSTLVNETSTSKAYYSYVNTSSGMYVFVYVPHFSNHTIEVSDTQYPVTNINEYYIIGGVIAVIAIIGIAAVVIKKRK